MSITDFSLGWMLPAFPASSQCSESLITITDPNWTYSNLFLSLLTWGRIRSLQLMLCPTQPGVLLAFSTARVFFWLIFYFVSRRSSRSFYSQEWEVLPDALPQYLREGGNFIHQIQQQKSYSRAIKSIPLCNEETKKCFSLHLAY